MTTTEKSTNQTVIPVMHPSMQGLIRERVGRGWISYEEINSALPDEFLSPGKIDDLLVLLAALNIELIGEDHRMRRGWDQYFVPLQTNLRFKRDTPWKNELQIQQDVY